MAKSQKALLGILCACSFACGGGGDKPPTAPPPRASAADTTPAASSAVESTTKPPPPPPPPKLPEPSADAPKVTFAMKDFAVGTVIDFTKSTRRQNVPLKNGKPGKATINEKTVAGTVVIKEIDDRKGVIAADVSFSANSTDAPLSAPKALGAGAEASFYAGKKFLLKTGPKGIEVSDTKGMPAFRDGRSISFITSVISQVVPLGSTFPGHQLANKLAGRTLVVGDKLDVAMYMPTPIFGKERTTKLANVKDGIAVLEMRVESSNETVNKQTGNPSFKSGTQGEGVVQVPVATSQWTKVEYKRATQSENLAANSEYTSEEEVSLSRTIQ